jgi:hypothetical protein
MKKKAVIQKHTNAVFLLTGATISTTSYRKYIREEGEIAPVVSKSG